MTVKELKDYKTNLYTSLSRNLSEFEKNFLLISGGILAFSITFIKEIVIIESAIFLVLLFISWGLIILSIGLMMIAYLRSSLASDKLWSLVDDFLLSNELFKDDTELSIQQNTKIKKEVNRVFYKEKTDLKYLRFLSVCIFILGIVFLSIYISVNLIHENKRESQKSIESKFLNDTIDIKFSNQSHRIIVVLGKNRKQYEIKTDSTTTINTKP